MEQNLTPRAMKDRVTDNMNALVGTFDSVSAASRAFGINRQQLNKYLSGARMPSLLTAAKISGVCNVGLDYLLSSAPAPDAGGMGSGGGTAPNNGCTDGGGHAAAIGAVAGTMSGRMGGGTGGGGLPAVAPRDDLTPGGTPVADICGAQFVFYMRSPVNPRLVFRGVLSLDAGQGGGRFRYYAPAPRRLLGGGGTRFVAAEGRYAAENNVFLLSSSRRDGNRGAVFVSALVHLGGHPGGRSAKYSVGRAIGAWDRGNRIAFSENVALKRLGQALGEDDLAKRCAVFDLRSGKARDTLVSVLQSLPSGNGPLPI